MELSTSCTFTVSMPNALTIERIGTSVLLIKDLLKRLNINQIAMCPLPKVALESELAQLFDLALVSMELDLTIFSMRLIWSSQLHVLLQFQCPTL